MFGEPRKYQFHIDGLLLKFLVNYLKDRTQAVVIGGNSSSTLPVLSGVPQGSILGPLPQYQLDQLDYYKTIWEMVC